jgi:hypothetical protein
MFLHWEFGSKTALLWLTVLLLLPPGHRSLALASGSKLEEKATLQSVNNVVVAFARQNPGKEVNWESVLPS